MEILTALVVLALFTGLLVAGLVHMVRGDGAGTPALAERRAAGYSGDLPDTAYADLRRIR